MCGSAPVGEDGPGPGFFFGGFAFAVGERRAAGTGGLGAEVSRWVEFAFFLFWGGRLRVHADSLLLRMVGGGEFAYPTRGGGVWRGWGRGVLGAVPTFTDATAKWTKIILAVWRAPCRK